ncbi:DAK2 domain-containing protein [Corynebacterium nuruki]|uniref:DAK2 domain-containing protein n=1 Tax=Corynebacterium nuruki TaxID=1032851 RepID=UPI0002486119|nr:DAK2 domain-containing protein [Corynebacterium nuruki]
MAPHNDPRDAGLTGELIAAWARRSAELLHHHRSEINGLNVFPIPDADTGSNMTATMESAVAALDAMQLPAPQDAATVAAALAAGAVRGARGNSGMVLSQILRALAETASMSPTGELNATAVPTMLTRAERLVCTAMSDPVEGTVITVLRRAAAGAAAVGPDAPLAVVADAARTAAQEALAATTDQLDALREAGVVDAGGRGLVVILDALHDALAGTAAGTTDAGAETGDGTGSGTGDGAPEQCAVTGAGAALEIMFTFRGPADRLRTVLERSGDSVIVVGDGGGAHRAHVHTRSAGPLIEEIFALGEVGDLRLEVLPESGVTEHDRGRNHRTSPVYALAPAGGPREIFARAGATVGDPAEVLPDDRVSIVLTNGQETGALPAALAAGLTVVDTGSLVGGLAALAVYSASADAEDNAEEMADAVSAQRSAVVPGSAADSTADAVVATAGDLLADGGELVTVLYDPALPEEKGATVQESLAASWPGVEVHTIPVPGLGMVAQVGVE